MSTTVVAERAHKARLEVEQEIDVVHASGPAHRYQRLFAVFEVGAKYALHIQAKK